MALGSEWSGEKTPDARAASVAHSSIGGAQAPGGCRRLAADSISSVANAARHSLLVDDLMTNGDSTRRAEDNPLAGRGVIIGEETVR